MFKWIKENKVVRTLFGSFAFLGILSIVAWVSFMSAEMIILNRVLGTSSYNNTQKVSQQSTYQANNEVQRQADNAVSGLEPDDGVNTAEGSDGSEDVMARIVLSEMAMPANAHIRDDFGWIRDEDLGSWRFNPGVTFMNSDEIVVVAAFDGTVEEVSFDENSQGFSVRMSHIGGVETVYSHVDNLNVGVGDFIKAGAELGVAGEGAQVKGDDEGSYYFVFEFYEDGDPVDPSPFIKVS